MDEKFDFSYKTKIIKIDSSCPPNAEFLKKYEEYPGIHLVKGYAMFKEQTFVDFIAEDDMAHLFVDQFISNFKINHSSEQKVIEE